MDWVQGRDSDRSHRSAYGIPIATAARVKWSAIVIVSLVTPPLIAQQVDSDYRKDCEKEKDGPRGECRVSS